jgi:superfamily II DNA or RNA helicase
MVKQRIVGCAVTEYRQRADGLPAVAFCPTVAFAEQVAADFRAAGIPAAAVDGGMAPHARAAALDGLRRGTIRVITSCDLISEGFDVPECAGALLLRPTKSLTLHLQQVGRALRPKADGSKAIILDHVGNCYDHGLPADTRAWSLEGRDKREQDASPIVQCQACYRIFDKPTARQARADRECPGGDHEWQACGLKLLRPSDIAEDGVLSVDGELREITARDLEEMDRPPWAGGLSLTMAKGYELETLLARANTRARLAQVAKARGYKPGWVHHQFEKRRRGATEVTF